MTSRVEISANLLTFASCNLWTSVLALSNMAMKRASVPKNSFSGIFGFSPKYANKSVYVCLHWSHLSDTASNFLSASRQNDVMMVPSPATLFVNSSPSFNSSIDLANEQNTTRLVGQWRVIPSGIWWSIPTFGHCTAEVHLHPFGPHPKMLQGVVVPDVTSRFRPVVATFDAIGVGPDLKDFAHAERGLGLGKTHTFWK